MASNDDHKPFKSIFRKVAKWQDLWFYQKSETLYQMTYVFCERFLPQYGDRTVDQMVQAARSGKQNIVEGSEDGKTSTQMEIDLLNVARSSIGELRQDYEDYLKSRRLHQWKVGDERYQPMQDFTKAHNRLADYEPFFYKWSAEEIANVGLTMCFQIDTMMNKYLDKLEHTFVTEGGIKERVCTTLPAPAIALSRMPASQHWNSLFRPCSSNWHRRKPKRQSGKPSTRS